MKIRLFDISQQKAAIVIGIAIIISYFLAFFVDDFLLPNFIRPGDTAALARDIKANEMLFGIAVIGYLCILTCDAAVALGLYVIFKPVNKNLALLTAVLRLLYVAFAIFGIFCLVFQVIDVYGYETMKLIAYVFFPCHLFVTGYSVFKSSYIPRVLGAMLIVVSFCYIVFFVDFLLPEVLSLVVMLYMAIGEISLDLWLLLKNAKLQEMIEEKINPTEE